MDTERITSQPQYDHMNGFLLCAIVAKRARHLEGLMPGRRVPELIAMALRNCADHELKLDINAQTPEVVRQEAMEIGQVTKHAISIDEAAEPSGRPAHATLIPRLYSPNGAEGIDAGRLRELRAITTNLCEEASHHREKGDYLVSYGLYDRALAVLEAIHVLDPDTRSLVRRIHLDQQRVFEMLRAGNASVDQINSNNRRGEQLSAVPSRREAKLVDRVHTEVFYDGANAVNHQAGSSTAD